MSGLDGRLSKLMPSLSAKERAVLALRAQNAGQDATDVRRSMPAEQRHEYNRFMALAFVAGCQSSVRESQAWNEIFQRPSGHGWTGGDGAYSVSLPVPAEMMGETASLLFDFFDNRNGINSLAYFGEINLLGEIARPPRRGLMSAATPLGPYAFEDDFETSLLARTVSLPRVPRRRFYRLQAEGPCRFLPVRNEGDDFVFPYEFLSPAVALEKSSDLKRWVPVPDALVAISEKIISAPWDPTASFFRLTGNLRTHIVALERQENTLLIRFDFQPVGLALLSSAQPDGPFAVEQNARHDAVVQAVRIPRRGSMLFFRFSPDDTRDLTDVRLEGDRVVCGYRVREANGTNSTQRSNFPL